MAVVIDTRRRLRELAAAALLLAAGCGGGGPAGTGTFPLDEGLSWRYDVVTTTQAGTSREVFEVTNLGPRGAGDTEYYVRRTSSGTDYHFVTDSDGVWRVGKRLVVELEPQPDLPPRLVLPATPAVGAQWQNSTHPYVLQRLVNDGVDMRRAYVVPMNYTVEAVDDTVSVPAGEFSGCVKVVGRAELQMYVDGPTGLRSIPLVTEEWYAPDVGLVRLRRTETIESTLMASGTFEMSLAAFARD
ncbi:MAG: TapB family protein [Gammaproteobacteria bacterium]